MTIRQPLPAIAACAVVVTALAGFLGNYGFHPEEARYAEIAREMLTSGDWLRPRLNGALYFEKPPLAPWLGAFLLQLFPQSPEWALRPVTAASGLLAIGSLAYFCYKTAGRASAIAAALLLATIPLATAFSRTFATDGLFYGLLTFALAMLGVETLQKRARAIPLLLAGAALGLASLARSPIVAFAIYGPVACFAALEHAGWRPRQNFGAALRFIIISIALPAAAAAAIAGPWFYQIQRAEPAFFDDFFVKHHFGRIDAPENEKALHREPFWFYLPALLGALGPLALAFLYSCVSLRSKIFNWSGGAESKHLRFAAFATAWIFVLFTILSGKRSPYILPALPWCAVLLASTACAAIVDRKVSRMLAICLLPACAAAVAVFVLLNLMTTGLDPAFPIAVRGLFLAAALGATAWPAFELWRGRTVIAGYIYSGFVAILFCILSIQLQRLERVEELTINIGSKAREFDLSDSGQKMLANEIAARAGAGDIIAQHGRFRHALNFYTNRRTMIFGSLGELAFGYERNLAKSTGGDPSIPPRYKEKEFLPFLTGKQRLFAIGSWNDFFDTPPRADPALAQLCTKNHNNAFVYVLARRGGLIAFTNRAP
ncbi:MAG: glycosyltransferase family 39 protein [Planctomycetota bacterium]